MGAETPEKGDKVSWNWGGGAPGGTVAETMNHGAIEIKSKRGNTIKKKADPGNPAVHIARSGNDVVKRASELTVEQKGSGNTDENDEARGEKRKAKDQGPKDTEDITDDDESEEEKDDRDGEDIESEEDEEPHTKNKQGKEVKKGGKEANKKQKRKQDKDEDGEDTEDIDVFNEEEEEDEVATDDADEVDGEMDDEDDDVVEIDDPDKIAKKGGNNTEQI